MRLSRIERRLFRADRRGDGVVRVCAFEDALAAEAKTEKEGGVRPNEALWLIEKLKDRNGRKVAIFKIRAILESRKEERGQGRNGVRTNSHARHRQRERGGSRNSRSRRSEVCRSRKAGRDRMGGEGGASESDTTQGDAIGLSSHPARWAVRQGTVGQWLYEAASPMVSVLLAWPCRRVHSYLLASGCISTSHYSPEQCLAASRYLQSGFVDIFNSTSLMSTK